MKGPRIYNALSDEERIARLERKAKKRVREVHRIRRNRILAAFAIVFLLLGVQIAIMLSQTHRINSQVQSSRTQLVRIKKKNHALTAHRDDLKDPNYLAKVVRQKFLYSKPGETIYKTPADSDSNQ